MAESLKFGVNEEADQFVRGFHAILILLKRNKISKEEVIGRLIDYFFIYSCAPKFSSGFERIPKSFWKIYSLTMDDDLRRFDSMYSPDNITSEKMEIGLQLMEIRNNFLEGYRTFESSSTRKIAVYFSRDDDNINDERYSYPRAVIHTARPLSNAMLQHKMISDLGLSIGWRGLMHEPNLMNFFDALNTNNDALQGFDDVKRNPSIICLVTIPKIKPHTYLNLSKAEALIFIIFNMINDIEINLKLRITDRKAPLKTNFTADTLSKLRNLSITFTNLDLYSKAIIYATKVCLIHKRRSLWISFKDMIKTECIKDMLNPYTYTRITDSDVMRENVNEEDIIQFIRLFYRIALKGMKRQGDPKNEIIKENEIKSKKDEIEQVCKAHEFSSKTASGKIERLPKCFRLKDFQSIFEIFSTVDLPSINDLKRFDFMYSSDNITSDLEKIEVGLQLMERGNTFKKDFRGQHRTFETSSKRAITVYFPMPTDINYGEYFYSRAVIHTARPLSNAMLQRKMMSALGLSIGWEGMTNEANLTRFLDIMNSEGDFYINDINDIKRNPSIIYLVTIPKIRPHEYLNLSKAEALIFITYNIICDSVTSVTNLKLQMSNPNTLKANFTAETISTLNNLPPRFPTSFNKLNFKSLDSYYQVITYAARVCITDIMHKGRLPSMLY